MAADAAAPNVGAVFALRPKGDGPNSLWAQLRADPAAADAPVGAVPVADMPAAEVAAASALTVPASSLAAAPAAAPADAPLVQVLARPRPASTLVLRHPFTKMCHAAELLATLVPHMLRMRRRSALAKLLTGQRMAIALVLEQNRLKGPQRLAEDEVNARIAEVEARAL